MIQIGVQTYSYRSLRDIEAAIGRGRPEAFDRSHLCDYIVENQINTCEFWLAFLEPTEPTYSRTGTTPAMTQNRDSLLTWRESQQPKEIFAYAKEN